MMVAVFKCYSKSYSCLLSSPAKDCIVTCLPKLEHNLYANHLSISDLDEILY